MLAFIKKYAVLLVAGILLAGAVYVNIRLNSDMATEGEDQADLNRAGSTSMELAFKEAETDYFESFRQERDAVRTTEIGYLDEVIAVSFSDAETLADAQSQKLALVENMEKEFIIESLIRAKGFDDVAVTFHKGSVNVIVDCIELTSEKVAQVLDIVKRETGEVAGNVKIIKGGS